MFVTIYINMRVATTSMLVTTPTFDFLNIIIFHHLSDFSIYIYTTVVTTAATVTAQLSIDVNERKFSSKYCYNCL